MTNNGSASLSLNEKEFTEHFPWNDFSVQHRLAGNDLFKLDNLIELCQQLPTKQVEYNLGNLPIEQDPDSTPLNDLSPKETIERIEQCGSWLVMKNVENIPEYGKLMDACLDQISEQAKRKLSNLHGRESFIFVSSPNAITPFHVDPEHNFLLQIQGSKTMKVWQAEDREVLPQTAIENTFYGDAAHRNLPYQEDFDSHARAYQLSPGSGLYVPVHAPHWVENGPDVSVSFSITFRSSWSVQNEAVHQCNARMRKLGISPSAVGYSAWRDSIKHVGYRGYRKILSLAGK